MHKNLGYVVENGGKTFYITDSEKVNKLEPGCYSIEQDPSGIVYIEPVSLPTETVIQLPGSNLLSIIDQVNKFWTQSDVYKQFKLPHKRGILIHGKSGTGKTTMIFEICAESIKNDALIFFCNQFDDVFKTQIKKIRLIEPDRPIVIVLDQIERIMLDEGNLINIDLLDFIDGISGIDKVLFIASTSDMEYIPPTVKQRPSRFDLKIELTPPGPADRKFFFNSVIPESEIKDINLDEWVAKTNNYTVSHLKELVVSYFIYKIPFKSAISNINKILNSNDRVIGFESSEE